jgi:2-dehydro-3-deoxyphosphooctonate aldolase (KDO 8-P synthase)
MFGYNNLVVDMRSLPIMRQYSPVVFDVTHSIQRPGGLGGKSGGDRQFAPYLASAAAAVGVDGFFIETHPKPELALSDGPNMVPLPEMRSFLKMLKSYWDLTRAREF